MTDRQKNMKRRAYDMGMQARSKGIGLKAGGKLYDFQARDKAAASVASMVGAYPGDERDDVTEAYTNGWNERDYQIDLMRNDPRTYEHAYGFAGGNT